MKFANIKYPQLELFTELDREIEFLRGADKLKPGRYELEGGEYANVMEYVTKEPGEYALEAHRKYVDLQYIVEGSEVAHIGDINLNTLKTPYDEKIEAAFYNHESERELVLHAGDFVLLYPEDGHCVRSEVVGSKVKKVVLKIPV